MQFDKFFLSTPISILTALLLPAAGIWGPLHYDELINAPNSWASISFWFIIFIFIIFHGCRTGASNRFQQSLVQQSRNLETAILTMPPEGFMAVYGKAYAGAHKVYKTITNADDANTEEYELSIRALLSAVITLTMKFDKNSERDKSVYHANIMFFCDTYKNSEDERKQLRKYLVFGGEALDLNELAGALFLENKLSTNSKTHKPEIDETIENLNMALPVPQKITTQFSEKTQVLPGAPYAFVTGELNRFTQTPDLYKWMGDQGDFNDSIITEVKNYFEDKNNDVKSFVSIPLIDEKDETIAILNIHKTTEGLLENDKKLELYYETMKPILRILSELIMEWATIKNGPSQQSCVQDS